jgi:hypothetical protein
MRKKTLAYWKKVVFTDESKIKISGSDGRVFVWWKSTVTLLHPWFSENWRGVNYGMGRHVSFIAIGC